MDDSPPNDSSGGGGATIELRIVSRGGTGGSSGTPLYREALPLAGVDDAALPCHFHLVADHDAVVGQEGLPILFIASPKVRCTGRYLCCCLAPRCVTAPTHTPPPTLHPPRRRWCVRSRGARQTTWIGRQRTGGWSGRWRLHARTPAW